jgi:uncharacterized protein with PIN domain
MRYTAENLRGCLVETMARFRPNPAADALLAAVESVDADDEPESQTAQAVEDWLAGQRVGQVTLVTPQPLLVRSSVCAGYTESAGIVLDHQRDPVISRSLDELLVEAEFVIEPVTEHRARLARQPYADFGGGSGHRAGLNFGDCYGTSTRHQLVVCGDPDFIRQVGGPDVAHRLNLQPP